MRRDILFDLTTSGTGILPSIYRYCYFISPGKPGCSINEKSQLIILQSIEPEKEMDLARLHPVQAWGRNRRCPGQLIKDFDPLSAGLQGQHFNFKSVVPAVTPNLIKQDNCKPFKI